MKCLILLQSILATGILYIFTHLTVTPPADDPSSKTVIYDFQTPKPNILPSSPPSPNPQDRTDYPTRPKPQQNATTGPKSEQKATTGPNPFPFYQDTLAWKGQPPPYTEYSCPGRDQRLIMLCRLGMKQHCQTKYLSEVLDTWWMVCPIYAANFTQAELLYKNHINFRNYAKTYGINFQTVEVIFPGQEYKVTQANNTPYDLQYTAEWIFAMRENLVNVGSKYLPDDWQYISWIDAHIFWKDPYWFEKSIWLFEHYNVVHLMSKVDFNLAINKTDFSYLSFGYVYARDGMEYEKASHFQYGIALGSRRDMFEQIGGLLDVCIGLLCDLYQSYGYLEQVHLLNVDGKEYSEAIIDWQTRAGKIFKKSVGFLDSTITHFKHCLKGCETSNWPLHSDALKKFKYNPNTDLHRDEEGRLTLVRNMQLAKTLWTYYGGSPRLLRRR